MFHTTSSRRRALLVASVIALGALVTGGPTGAEAEVGKHPRPTIVLVHGDWADGSSWTGVIERLQRRDHTVVAPANPLRGPNADAAYLAGYLRTIAGPIVLVAHSYGGFVATNAAAGNTNVKALVYIDAFMPEQDDTLFGLTSTSGSCIDENALSPVPLDGVVDLYLRWEPNGTYPGYLQCFANGVRPKDAAVLHAAQRPAAAAQFGEPSGPPAWSTIPSWALIGTSDRVIPPALQETKAELAGSDVTRVRAGHLSLITHPGEVTKVILAAVESVR